MRWGGGMEVDDDTKAWLSGLKSMEQFLMCRLEWLYAFPYIINSHTHKGANFGTPPLEKSG